jgi:predicted Zn-dependent protease
MRLARTGSVDEARNVLAQGAGASVDNDFSRSVAVDLDLLSGRYRDVLERTSAWTEDVLDSQTWYIPVSWVRAVAWRGLGEPDSARVDLQIARRLLEERVDRHPDDARAHGALGRVYAALGRDDEAIRSARRGVELVPYSRDAVLAPYRMHDLAAVYAMTGRDEDAISQLQALLAVPGIYSVQSVRTDPLWAPLRADPQSPGA